MTGNYGKLFHQHFLAVHDVQALLRLSHDAALHIIVTVVGDSLTVNILDTGSLTTETDELAGRISRNNQISLASRHSLTTCHLVETNTLSLVSQSIDSAVASNSAIRN